MILFRETAFDLHLSHPNVLYIVALVTVFSHGLSVSRLCQNCSSARRSVLLGRKLPKIRFCFI
ncbi:hypothetical protein C3731_14030 [Brucella oryzae]|uniref:Uncharacterized protein n=1 Tax=Brucella oryzae TaxID=335286 RepID=A0A2S7IXT8_9HYPH|nr:hypothetical protein C3731_14030 [Brucella oryzae]